MSKSFYIQLFEEFSLAADGLPIQGINSERLQALLAFMVLHRDIPQQRQQVAVHLWPEVTDTDAKANLRRRLHELKQVIPAIDRWLRIETKTIQWLCDENCRTDVAEFESAMLLAEQSSTNAQSTISSLEQAAKLYRGDLLPSCYDDWIVPYREKLRQQAIAALDKLVTLLTTQKDQRQAIAYAQQLQRIDPLYEPAYCHLMRLHAGQGDRASALRVYHQCMTTLQAQLGVNPSPTTYKLYEELLLLEDAPSPPTCTATTSTDAPDFSNLIPISSPTLTVTAELPLIGRETEWAAIEEWRSQCQKQEQSDLLWILGEPGIGKTRLLEELAKTVQASGSYVLWGRGYEAEMLRPYGVWVDMFQAIGATKFLDELRSLVLSVESAATLNRGRVFDLAVQFISQLAATAPVLVVLDDIQWLDETSIAFLHYAVRLLNQQKGVWFACAARKREIATNPPADKFIQTLHREHRIRKVELTPLDSLQTLALAQAVGYTADDDRIFTSSGGNPLFTLEIVRARAQSERTAADSLEMLIQGRLRQLDETTQELMPWMAALGHSFNPTTLAKVADFSLPRLLSAIDRLEQHGIIRPGSAIAGEMCYNFAHDIVRQVAYEQFSEPRRRLIHTHIAQTLNAIATPTSPLINDVARHADLGSDHALAATACLQAAERCLRVFAYGEAAELTQRGIRHCQYLGITERIHLHLNLLKTSVKAGVPKQQAAVLKQELQSLIQEAATLELKEDEATGLEALIVLNYDQGNLSEVQQYSLRAAEQGRSASPATTMYMLAHTGACLAEIGREMTRAEALLLEAQSISDRLGTSAIDIPFGLGCVRRFQGDSEQAQSLLRQGWHMAQTACDHWRECTCLTNLVMLELETGNPVAALNDGNELIHVAAQMGEGSEAPHAAALNALTQYLLQKQNATEILEQSCQVLQRIDSPRMLAYVQTIAARWDLAQGDLTQAIARAEKALEAAQVVNNCSEIALAWAVVIQANHQSGNLNCAQQHFAEMKTRLKDSTLSAQAQQSIAAVEAYLHESIHPQSRRKTA
ncbi:AAA family ATPase [Tolypothrix sp. PCC 7910]|uniref:BTAD domain-containing putative transcriptional regulator n=1 Tax=Tolypothrix sp. PCC 7910 TaxID=2099387 RepID=UPI0014277032|nr:BTAD domain-containing putative transcriptional regulator [Tolypothrix sp. PCC 7910]QIR37183.1 AAA family ATPase [Tolypothrix sp. PCC 7910]